MSYNLLFLLLPVFIVLELVADLSILRIVKEMARNHIEVYRRAGFEQARDSMTWGLVANFKLPFMDKRELPEPMRRKLHILAAFRIVSLCYALLLGYALLAGK